MRIPCVLVVATAVVLVAAHDDELAARAYQMRRYLMERQATTTPGTGTPTPAPSASTPPAATSVTITSPGSNSTTTSPPSIVLASTNPTAVPLSDIVSFQSSSPTKPLPATPVAGTVPSSISGAPPLPDAAIINPQRYPKLDTVPPTDSAEVQEWIAEVAATGIVIPKIEPTVDGGCPANAAAAADRSRCWWTCTGCTGATDITECPTAMDWGLTYDDGPGYYTPNLLEYLDSQRLKSTFFVVGSRVVSFPRTLQYEYINSHQIAVHTWSHHALTQLSNDQIIAELGWSRKVIKDVLGVTPNMMRPPFGDIDNRVRAISLAMGLTPVMWTRVNANTVFDTGDFYIHGGTTTVYQVLQNWQNILRNATTLNHGFIVLEHDLFLESVEVATGYILPDALAHNPPFSIKPVSSCLRLNLADAYVETNDNRTHPPALPAAISAGVVTTTSVSPTATRTTRNGARGLSASPFGAVVATVFGVLIGASIL